MLRARKLVSAALTACLVTLGGVGATVLSAGAAQAAACPTASQIVADVNAIASTTGGLTAQLGTLSVKSSSGDVRSVAQSTATGLNTVIGDLSADAAALNGCPKLGTQDAQSVANAFDSLTATINQLVSTLTADHPIFAQYGVTAPIAASLRSLEAAVDYYAFALLAVAPSQQAAISDDLNAVNDALDAAIGVFNQICIPSPLYPTIPPICAVS